MTGHKWAKKMKDLLTEGGAQALRSRQAGVPLEPEVLQSFRERYDAILQTGEGEWSKDWVRAKTCKKGRAIKSRAGNLGEPFRFTKRRFSSFFGVPRFRLITTKPNVISEWLR